MVDDSGKEATAREGLIEVTAAAAGMGAPLRVESVSLVGEGEGGDGDGGVGMEPVAVGDGPNEQASFGSANGDCGETVSKVEESRGVSGRSGNCDVVDVGGEVVVPAGKERGRLMTLHTVGISLEVPTSGGGRSWRERAHEKSPSGGDAAAATCTRPRQPTGPRRSSASPRQAKQEKAIVVSKGLTSTPASPRFKSTAIKNGQPRESGATLVPPLDFGRLGLGSVAGVGIARYDEENKESEEEKEEVAALQAQQSQDLEAPITGEGKPSGTETQTAQSSAEAAWSIIKTWSPRVKDSLSGLEVAGDGATAADVPLSVRTQQGRFTTKSRRVGRAAEGPTGQDMYAPFRPTHRQPPMCEEVGSAPDPGEWTQRGTRFGTSPRFHDPPAADENGPPPVWTGERVAGLRVGGSTGTENTNVSIYSGYHRPRAASMPNRQYKPPIHGTLEHSVWSNPYRETSRDGSSTHFMAHMVGPGPTAYRPESALRRKLANASESRRGSASFASSATRALPYEPVTFSGKYIKPAEVCYSSVEGDARAWHRQQSSYTGKMVCTSPRRCVRSERDNTFVHPRPRAAVLDWRDTVAVDEAAVGPGRYDPPRWPLTRSKGHSAAQDLRGCVIGAGFTSRPPARQIDASRFFADLNL